MRIASFWGWWNANKGTVGRAIEQGTSDRLVTTLTQEVRTVDPRLAWELMPGQTSRHVLVLTGEGDADAAWVAAAAIRSAPVSDSVWSYRADRPRQHLRVVSVAGHQVDLRAFTATASRDAAAERLDVELANPSFARMPAAIREQAAYLFIDALLGESDRVRWVGSLRVMVDPLELSPQGLFEAVARLREEASGSQWALISRVAADGRAVLVYVNTALKRFDHLDDRWHAVVDLSEDPGVVSDSALSMTADPIPDLEAAGGTLVAVTKDRFRRRFHLVYANGSAVPAAARRWASRVSPSATVALDFDPLWVFLEELTSGTERELPRSGGRGRLD